MNGKDGKDNERPASNVQLSIEGDLKIMRCGAMQRTP